MSTARATPSYTLSAPGKVFLAGEYAVLTGAPAVVLAVDRRAVARVRCGAEAQRPAEQAAAEVGALPGAVARAVTAALAHAGLAGPPALTLSLDTSALHDPRSGRPLGLGSSAAGAAAVAAALGLAAGLSPADPTMGPRLLEAALAGHRQHQGGRGSGADVAAAWLGGLIAFRSAAPWQRLDWPAGLRLAVVRVGPGGAGTAGLIGRVLALAAPRREPLLDRLGRLAEAVVTALGSGDCASGSAGELLLRFDEIGRVLDELGRAAGVPIVGPLDRALAEAARSVGGAAKPSGAGGGELGLLLAPDDATLAELRVRALALGAEPLELVQGADGVRWEP